MESILFWYVWQWVSSAFGKSWPGNKPGPVSKTCMLAQTNPQSCVQSWGRFGLHWQPKEKLVQFCSFACSNIWKNGEAKHFFWDIGQGPKWSHWYRRSWCASGQRCSHARWSWVSPRSIVARKASMDRFASVSSWSPPFLKHLLAKTSQDRRRCKASKQHETTDMFPFIFPFFSPEIALAVPDLVASCMLRVLDLDRSHRLVWSLNYDPCDVEQSDVDYVVDGRLTRREFVCAVVLQKLATPPEAGMEDVIIRAEPFYSLTRHLYFLKCYAMVNLVQDLEHYMRKANWFLC